jgi:hypothetical protein
VSTDIDPGFAQRTPCADCPYRKDAPLKLWDRAEFVDLLASERSQFGKLYGCHKQNGNACIGWLLDQRKNGVGSIALRMRLITKPEAARQFEECHSGGAKMFVSVAAMCRANGVRGRR